MSFSLTSRSITKLKVKASSDLPNDPSSPSLSHNPKTINLKPNKLSRTNYKKQQLQQQQPQILEIERAIGAGVFRDRDVNSESEGETANLFENIIRNSVGKNEGSVEKKLRETGEWLLYQSETTSRKAGKQILLTIFLWMIPMWIIAFLVASGIVRLPFDTPFLDDLIS